MGAELPRKANQVVRQVKRQPQPAVLQIEVQRLGMVLGDALLAPAPDLAGQGARHVLRQAQRLAHVPHGAAGAKTHDGCAQRGAVTAVMVIDPLDHFLPPVVLEVHVYVRRLPAGSRYEALEQQVGLCRVQASDAQHVANGGVGGATPPLAQDVTAAGKADDAVDGQEVRCILKLRDQVQLVPQLIENFVWNASGIAPCRTVPGHPLQGLLRRKLGVPDLVRILVAQVAEIEPAASHQFQGAFHGVGVAGEQPGHLGGGLQVPVGMAFPPEPGGVNGGALADAGDDILQDAALRHVIQHVAGGDHRRPGGPAQFCQAIQPGCIAGPPPHRPGQVGAARRVGAQPGKLPGQGGIVGRHQHQQQPGIGRRHVVPSQVAAALVARPPPGPRPAQRQQPAQPSPCLTVPRKGQQRGTRHARRFRPQVQAAAGNQPHAGFLRAFPCLHDAGDRVAVGDAQRRNAQFLGLAEQLVRMAGAAQEGVVARDLQLGIAARTAHAGTTPACRLPGPRRRPGGTARSACPPHPRHGNNPAPPKPPHP